MAGELNVLRSNENHFILFLLLLKFMVCLLDDLNRKSVERFKGFLFQKSPQITLTSLGNSERTLCTYTGSGLSACRLLLLHPDVHKKLAALSLSLSLSLLLHSAATNSSLFPKQAPVELRPPTPSPTRRTATVRMCV